MCPYIITAYTKITAVVHDDTTSEPTEKGSYLSEQYIHPECLREKCGVWYEGKCCYKQ